MKGQMFRTTTNLSSRNRQKPIRPDEVVTVADLDPAADPDWLVGCGALVPIETGARLFADTPTAAALVEEVGRLQEVIEQQAAVIDGRDRELAAARDELRSLRQAHPTTLVGSSSALHVPTPSVGSDKGGMNPNAGRSPSSVPSNHAVITDAAGRLVANPDRPKRTQGFGDSQPVILPQHGRPMDAGTLAANVAAGVPAAALGAGSPAPQFDPTADTVAALRDENAAARAIMAKQAAELDALRMKLAAAPAEDFSGGLQVA